jgi:UDP-MurNAc hydroxylase
VLKKIKKFYKIDFLLVGYGGAGPYPQCFQNLDFEQKKAKALEKKENFLNMSLNYIREVNPNFYMPFAGTYVLTGKLSNLQDLRGVPSLDQAYNYLEKSLSQTKSKCIKLNPGSYFSLANQNYSDEYKILNNEDMIKYIENNLKNKKFIYEDDPEISFEELFDLAKLAMIRFTDKKKELKVFLDTDVLLKVEDRFIHIDNCNNNILIKSENQLPMINKYIIYELDKKLLKRILLGPRFAHWNNSEIGSHIKFFRKPDVFDRKVYNAMSYFHI